MIDNDTVFFLEIEDIENIYQIAKKTFIQEDYKMPELTWLNKNKMIASINGLKNGYYLDVAEMAAALVYYINKSHPFKDGNKRMSYIILFTFLFMNSYAQKRPIKIHEGISFIESIAAAQYPNKEDTIARTRKWINKNFRYNEHYLEEVIKQSESQLEKM